MISFMVGYEKYPVQWDKDKECLDVELYEKVKTMQKPTWLHVDGKMYKLDTDCQLKLACLLVADYHNTSFYTGVKDDGWEEETMLLEQKAQAFMDEPSDDGNCSDGWDDSEGYEEFHDKK